VDETEFRIVELEYKQASLLIQRGIEIFIRIVKLFIYSNIALLLLVNLWLKFGSTQNVRLFASYIALLGIAVCLSMFIFQKMMVICVRRWLERASELEAQFGGRIFTRTLDIEKQNRNSVVQPYPVLLLLYALFALGWAVMVFAALVE
jgi:hypothetical protein